MVVDGRSALLLDTLLQVPIRKTDGHLNRLLKKRPKYPSSKTMYAQYPSSRI
jgi:hypothetical protein